MYFFFEKICHPKSDNVFGKSFEIHVNLSQALKECTFIHVNCEIW